MQLVFVKLTVLLLSAWVTAGQNCINFSDYKSQVPCCKIHDFFPSYAFSGECHDKFVELKNAGQLTRYVVCRLECIGQTTGAVVGETIDAEVLHRYADSYFRDDIAQAFHQAIDQCIAIDIPRGPDHQLGGCNLLAKELNFCLRAAMVQLCPEELRVETATCGKMRAGTPVCKFRK